MAAVAASPAHSPVVHGRLVRFGSRLLVALATAFILNAFLTFSFGLPGAFSIFLEDGGWLGLIQIGVYVALAAVAAAGPVRDPNGLVRADAERLEACSAYVIRAAYWSVLIVGSVDMAISFLRVEGFLPVLVGDQLATSLGIPNFRGAYVHVPLMVLSILVAIRSRTPGFTWLAVLVVVAEFLIVIARFVFSYEQAFMGDLVRFWYAALFLFASAQTLVEEGHVRVDVLFAGFSNRKKAWVNFFGSLILGIPLCAAILLLGLREKTSIIASPILAFETTQSGFGLYVKYMMAGFLGVFAYTMLVQFAAYMLSAAADLLGEPGGRSDAEESAPH